MLKRGIVRIKNGIIVDDKFLSVWSVVLESWFSLNRNIRLRLKYCESGDDLCKIMSDSISRDFSDVHFGSLWWNGRSYTWEFKPDGHIVTHPHSSYLGPMEIEMLM